MVRSEYRDILGVPVLAIDGSDAAAGIVETIANGGHARYAFLNAHSANLASADRDYRVLLQEFAVLPDGAGVDIASLWLYGEPFPENLNGTDFVPSLLGTRGRSWTVGLWGAAPGVAHAAADAWNRTFGHHSFHAVTHGFADERRCGKALERLAACPVDVLLVAMGNPRQERFIAEQIDARHARVVMGVGALFDFASGRIRRAPELARNLRAEWAFRLMLEPTRLSRRYLVGNPLFLARTLRQRSASLG